MLNEQVISDSERYVPFSQGGLRGSAHFPDGPYGETIEYNVPYAHYQYMGEIYGPNIPQKDANGNIIGFWSPPLKTPTGRLLAYHTAGTGSHWFETAKVNHGKTWIDLVKRTVGK